MEENPEVRQDLGFESLRKIMGMYASGCSGGAHIQFAATEASCRNFVDHLVGMGSDSDLEGEGGAEMNDTKVVLTGFIYGSYLGIFEKQTGQKCRMPRP